MTPMRHHERKRMPSLVSIAAIGATAFLAGCGSQDETQLEAEGSAGETCTGGTSGVGAGGAGEEAGCVSDGENVLCAPIGFPFVTRTFAVTTSCVGSGCPRPNPTLTQPEAGVLCMSGTAPGSHEAGFPLILFSSTPDFSTIVRPFDADALGITDVSFTIDSLPEGGLLVDAGIVRPGDCSNTLECVGFGFTLPRIIDAGPTTVPLVDFLQSDPASSDQTFDTSSLSHIGFTAGEGPYDFCLSDFKFLDAFGDSIEPDKECHP
jgi:hypothetical protein